MCRNCKTEHKVKLIESFHHATYECRIVKYIYRKILAEFELEAENLNSGSVV